MKNEKKLKVFASELEKVMQSHNLEVLIITENTLLQALPKMSNSMSAEIDKLQAYAVIKNESNPYHSFLDIVHNLLLECSKKIPLNNVLIQILNIDSEFNKFEARLSELISKIAEYTSIIHNNELIDDSFLGVKLYPGQIFSIIRENQKKQQNTLEKINEMMPFSSLKLNPSSSKLL